MIFKSLIAGVFTLSSFLSFGGYNTNKDLDENSVLSDVTYYYATEETNYETLVQGTTNQYTLIDETTLELASGCYVVRGHITLNSGLKVNGLYGDKTYLILENGSKLTINANENEAGIAHYGDSTLIITGNGILNVNGGDNGAGIGGYISEDNFNTRNSGNIQIFGGTINAVGGSNAAGIGSTEFGNMSEIIINSPNGVINATGGEFASGIGSGKNCMMGSTIDIIAGTITAIGGENGSGIGAGLSSEFYNSQINVKGGYIDARGGTYASALKVNYIYYDNDISAYYNNGNGLENLYVSSGIFSNSLLANKNDVVLFEGFVVSTKESILNEENFAYDVVLSNDNRYGAYYNASTYEKPLKANASFAGWYYVDDNGNETKLEDGYVFSKDTSLYARWDIVLSDKQQVYKIDEENPSYKIIGSDETGFDVRYKSYGYLSSDAPTTKGEYDVVITRVEDSVYNAYSNTIVKGFVLTDDEYEVEATKETLYVEAKNNDTLNVIVPVNDGSEVLAKLKTDLYDEYDVYLEERNTPLAVNYKNIEDKELAITDAEKVGFIYDITLSKQEEDSLVDLQPKDLNVDKIVIKLTLPEGIDPSSIIRILHVHSETDIEEIPFDRNNLHGDVYELEASKLSEFAFVVNRTGDEEYSFVDDPDATGALIVIAVLVMCAALSIFLNKK